MHTGVHGCAYRSSVGSGALRLRAPADCLCDADGKQPFLPTSGAAPVLQTAQLGHAFSQRAAAAAHRPAAVIREPPHGDGSFFRNGVRAASAFAGQFRALSVGTRQACVGGFCIPSLLLLLLFSYCSLVFIPDPARCSLFLPDRSVAPQLLLPLPTALLWSSSSSSSSSSSGSVTSNRTR